MREDWGEVLHRRTAPSPRLRGHFRGFGEPRSPPEMRRSHARDRALCKRGLGRGAHGPVYRYLCIGSLTFGMVANSTL